MSIYAAIIVRQYAEGRICITSDRINGYLSTEGGTSALWRKVMEWTGQKRSFETINVAVINSSLIPYRNKLEELVPISFQELSLHDVTYNDISSFDLLYFVGLPSESSSDLERVLESYVKNGGGIYIEVPDRDGEIEILKNIESVVCSSINRPQFSNAYWTASGREHYIFVDPVNVGFLTTLDVAGFSTSWTPLMTNTTSSDNIQPEEPLTTIDKIGSEFGIGYTIAMQHGIVELETDMSTSSSSSIDSSSSSSSSSFEDDNPWSFCDNIVGQWKMNDNADNYIVWGSSSNFELMGKMERNTVPLKTSDYHVSGIINGALSFDGNQSYVTTSNTYSLNFTNTFVDLPFSVSFWIYPIAGSGHILYKQDCWEVYLDSSVLYFRLHDIAGTREFYMSSRNIQTDEWSNITLSYDGTFNGLSIYCNGILESQVKSESSYTTMKNTVSTFIIAAETYSGTNCFTGYIDNVIVLDRELSLIEVDALWNEGRGTEECSGIYTYPSSSSSSSESSSSSS